MQCRCHTPDRVVTNNCGEHEYHKRYRKGIREESRNQTNAHSKNCNNSEGCVAQTSIKLLIIPFRSLRLLRLFFHWLYRRCLRRSSRRWPSWLRWWPSHFSVMSDSHGAYNLVLEVYMEARSLAHVVHQVHQVLCVHQTRLVSHFVGQVGQANDGYPVVVNNLSWLGQLTISSKKGCNVHDYTSWLHQLCARLCDQQWGLPPRDLCGCNYDVYFCGLALKKLHLLLDEVLRHNLGIAPGSLAILIEVQE
mmetsp:Transcript_528/g.1890  ORF Transcript_528/g.1890 Transcript_528/m.1890 type:complete len:249 (+) Transcript_528:161-907(+)